MDAQPRETAPAVVPLRIGADELQRMAHLVRYLWWRGRLSDEECTRALYALTGRDDAGDYWLVGANTGRWYRRTDDSWTQGEPAGTLVTAVAVDAYEQLVREMRTPYRLEDRILPAAPAGGDESPTDLPTVAEAPVDTETAGPAASPAGPGDAVTGACPACRAHMPADARFCMYCGTRLGEAWP